MSVMRGHATSVFAGFATALICLPEYLGLGAMIGSATGGGASASGLAALLVVISVVLASMPIRAQKAVLSGPRAASVSVMVFMLSWIAPSAPSLGMVFLAAPAMVILAALLCLISSHPIIIERIQRMPEVVSHTFLFATGVGIISEALRKQYSPCVEVAPVAAPFLLILLALLTMGAIRLKQRFASAWVSMLPLAVIGIAWALHMLLIGNGSQGACRPLGVNGIQWSAWFEHLSRWNHAFANNSWSYLYLLKLLAAGFMLGLVMSLENHMFVKSAKSDEVAGTPEASRLKEEDLLRRNSGHNVFSGMLTGMPASMSTARTRLLAQFDGKSRLAVWSHGIFLILVVSTGQPLLAQFPAMAICSALLLAGLLMIDNAMAEGFWSKGIKSSNSLHASLWIFTICTVLGTLIPNGNWIAMVLAGTAHLLMTRLLLTAR